MKIVAFTPTYRFGGLDVISASIKRQEVKPDIWLICDELINKRQHVWKEIQDWIPEVELIFIEPNQTLKNPHRNLVASYNSAADAFCDLDGDLFISFQDYIWLPPDGIKSFVDVNKIFPEGLLTGVTHISADPFPNTVQYKDGYFSLWEKPYLDKPRRIHWYDARVESIYKGIFNDGDILIVEPNHWEANWSAVPGYILKNDVRWDIEYDKGVAYENMDFAKYCEKEFNTKTVMDTKNISISLPHKEYFDGEKEEIINFSNRKFFEEKWNI